MAKKDSNKDNLTKITGVGPKIQQLLNAGGIMTYDDLANAKKGDLDQILEDAGSRFNAHDPSTWMKQAKELAKASGASKTATSKPKSKPKLKPKPKTSVAASKIKEGELELPKFRKIMNELSENVEDLTKLTVRKYQKDAKRDAEKMIRGMKRDLRRWTRQLEKGDLTTMDFEFLVKSNVDKAKMGALESSGLALIRLQAYRNSLLNLIIDTVFGLALKALK
jgi:nucleotidyltransferase/DNA polymerase involved in DNA repair